MTRLICNISISLDGFVAGPDATLEEPLGKGGEQLHEWIFGERRWREQHGLEGGERGPSDEILRESIELPGASVMGRRMFSGGDGPWSDDPNADAWWGDDPPFDVPVFVVTHHARETVDKGKTSYTFVTGGLEAALAQAAEAAGDKPVAIAGGASLVQQSLQAGLLDELEIHVAPFLLGGGVRLFEGAPPAALELVRVVDAPNVTHIKYRTGGK